MEELLTHHVSLSLQLHQVSTAYYSLQPHFGLNAHKNWPICAHEHWPTMYALVYDVTNFIWVKNWFSLDLIIFLQLEKNGGFRSWKTRYEWLYNDINWLDCSYFKCWRAPTTSSPPNWHDWRNYTKYSLACQHFIYDLVN